MVQQTMEMENARERRRRRSISCCILLASTSRRRYLRAKKQRVFTLEVLGQSQWRFFFLFYLLQILRW
ncbi:expressed protein [Arabidopsis lyrata subsp. lyrata]|uniref:Expressed protein n=1 Tax=Arabidopsis lyrata subsp. lyrata TaxID=81972 RepID=D7LKW3_ARALL|nr:expressed protein [Arabidopsis lyrata subsp. lyrata]